MISECIHETSLTDSFDGDENLVLGDLLLFSVTGRGKVIGLLKEGDWRCRAAVNQGGILLSLRDISKEKAAKLGLD